MTDMTEEKTQTQYPSFTKSWLKQDQNEAK
jgi:hypothetical protein